jgi:hypothetical protein
MILLGLSICIFLRWYIDNWYECTKAWRLELRIYKLKCCHAGIGNAEVLVDLLDWCVETRRQIVVLMRYDKQHIGMFKK